MGIIIGELKNGDEVMISNRSTNQHISLFGISGSGKSTRIKEILTSLSKDNYTVIVFDMNGMDFYPEGAVGCLNDGCLNRISALEDRISLQLLDYGKTNGEMDSFNEACYVADILSGIMRLGDRQTGALRNAIVYAVGHRSEFQSEMDAVSAGLIQQDTDTARGLSDKMGGILRCGILHDSGKGIETGKVNILSFQRVTPSIQKNLAEIVLASIWRMLCQNKPDMGKTAVVIDEFQNLSLKEDSTMLKMLRESRKFGVSMILSTQTAASFPKEILAVINQTAIQLYFRPAVSDINKTASLIYPANMPKWSDALRKLCTGESIVTGDVCVRGKDIHTPLIIRSHYKGS